MGIFRKFFNKYPALDAFRLAFCTDFCHRGIAMVDSGYDIVKLISPAARPYIEDGGGKQAIIALYHGRVVAMLGLRPRKRRTILISQSRDGLIISRAMEKLGFSVARGSPTKGAAQGARELMEAASVGQDIIFAVDGPRGPNHEVKPAIIRLAETTGLPIIPFVSWSRYNWRFKSWDKFMGALWGTSMLCMFGDPIFAPSGIDDQERERLRLELESRMDEMRLKLDSLWSQKDRLAF